MDWPGLVVGGLMLARRNMQELDDGDETIQAGPRGELQGRGKESALCTGQWGDSCLGVSQVGRQLASCGKGAEGWEKDGPRKKEGLGQLFCITSENQQGGMGLIGSSWSFSIKRIMDVMCSSERSDFLVML